MPDGEIAIAPVAHDEHDDRVAQLARHAQRHGTGATGRHAAEDALLRGEPARHVFRVGLAHVLDAVHARPVEDLRQVCLGPLADAGDLRSLLGLRADDGDRGVLLLEVARHAHDRAGRAHRRYEVRDPALRVAPDFRPRAAIVRQRIVGIRELIEDDALAGCTHLVGEIARALHAAALRHQHEFGAVRAHRLPALERLVVRHDENQPVAAHGGHHREGDAGVARCCLDQGVTRADLAATLGLGDHRQRRSVLDAARRIVALELPEDDVASSRRAGAAGARAAYCRWWIRGWGT